MLLSIVLGQHSHSASIISAQAYWHHISLSMFGDESKAHVYSTVCWEECVDVYIIGKVWVFVLAVQVKS